MPRDVGETDRVWVRDEQSEHPLARWWVADLPGRLGAHPARDEALEFGSGRIQHAKSRVGSTYHVPRTVDDGLEHRVKRALGIDAYARFYQALKRLSARLGGAGIRNHMRPK